MNNHNTNFYSIEEVERTLKSTKEFEDGEQLYYFIGALRYLYDNNKEKDKEIERLNNVINELKWKPIDEYFKNKENYDWVLVKYYDKYNFECIPSVAEYRFDKWYLKDNEKSLQDFEVKYFFDMQQLDKLKELKGGE